MSVASLQLFVLPVGILDAELLRMLKSRPSATSTTKIQNHFLSTNSVTAVGVYQIA